VRRIKAIIPNCTDVWNKPVKELLDKYKDDATEIDVVDIGKGSEAIESTYDLVWSELFVVQAAENAQKEGYDGVITYCFGDPGLRAAKEALDIPVVGLNEPSIHIASLLGDRFAIISPGVGKSISSLVKDKLKVYGLEDKCAAVRFADIPVLELETNREKTAKRIIEEARKAIQEDGADVIIFGCGAMLGIEEQVSQELGVPVVVPGVAGLKICEALIDMGLAQSKGFFVKPSPQKRLA